MLFKTAYVAFPAAGEPALTVAGKLRVPSLADGAAPRAAPGVVLCHGSDGVDGRGEFHAEALNEAGIATLEIDMWAARGAARGAGARPGSVPSTLPDAFGARAFLAAQPEVDPARVGIMGFSWGGVVSLLAATRQAVERHGGAPFAAHVSHYPVCWTYQTPTGFSLAELTGAPVLIQAGDDDAYDDPDGLDQLLARLPEASRAVIRGVTHADAGHGFDRDLPARTIVDPFAHKGAGGPVLMAFNARAARAARRNAVAHFREAFGLVEAAK
jgi:dienelactone hydrolase